MDTLSTLPPFLRRLYTDQNRKDIPRPHRNWFWKMFRALRAQGLDYMTAWHYTTWVLEHHVLRGR